MTGGYLALLAKCKYTFIDALLAAAVHAKNPRERPATDEEGSCSSNRKARTQTPSGSALLVSQSIALFVPFFYTGNKFNFVPFTKV